MLETRAATLAVLCIGVLIAQIDTSVVNLAVQPIGSCFSAGMAQLQWMVDSYNLVYAVFLLTGGILADTRGRRRILRFGLLVFSAASLLCGFSPSVSFLVAGRAVAGLGAALMIPSSLAIIRVIWTDDIERGRVLGIWASCYGLALAIGPTIGGLMIVQFGWRSIFLIAVPPGIIAFFLASKVIPESSDPDGRHFDLSAQMLGAIAAGALAMAAIDARESALSAAVFLAVAIIALKFFVTVESRKGDEALVPTGIFAIGEFRAAAAGAAGMTSSMYGLLFVLPQAWQETGNLGALGSGIALMPMAIIYVFVSFLSGTRARRFGVRMMASGGLAVIGAGLLVLTVANVSLWPDEIGLILAGTGMGLATGPLVGLAVGSVHAARSGTAASVINVARMIGATMGVAVLGAVYASFRDHRTGVSAAMILGSIILFSAAYAAWRATGKRVYALTIASSKPTVETK